MLGPTKRPYPLVEGQCPAKRCVGWNHSYSWRPMVEGVVLGETAVPHNAVVALGGPA